MYRSQASKANIIPIVLERIIKQRGLFFTASVSIINGDDGYILGSLLFTYVLPQVVYFPKRFCHDDSSHRNKHRNLLDKYSVSDFSNRVSSICFIT